MRDVSSNLSSCPLSLFYCVPVFEALLGAPTEDSILVENGTDTRKRGYVTRVEKLGEDKTGVRAH